MVVGLEVHAQVASKAKLFSGASTAFGAAPNTNVSLVDAAMPGMLPVINGFCVEQAVRTGLGLKATINLFSRFDRKNYFYPDLPQGYQISQLYHPIVGEGEVLVDLGPGLARKVRIERIHLEQDAGKSMHDIDPDLSCVDLNRTGVALMEIVSRPDIRGAEEAAEYLRKLRQILRYLGTCDGNMQEGRLRADVNVSVRPKGSTELGTRCEIKNMNSMRFIVQAIEFEARRQIAILEDGGAVEQETRLYDPNRGETRSMRSKEEAHDYRYFPDPDLLPLELEQAWIDAHRRGPARAARREEGALRRRLRHDRVRRRRADRRGGERRLLRGGGGGPRRQAGGELGDQRALRPAEPRGPRHRGEPDRARPARRADRPGGVAARSPARSPRTSSRSSGPRAAIRPRSSPSAACAR